MAGYSTMSLVTIYRLPSLPSNPIIHYRNRVIFCGGGTRRAPADRDWRGWVASGLGVSGGAGLRRKEEAASIGAGRPEEAGGVEARRSPGSSTSGDGDGTGLRRKEEAGGIKAQRRPGPEPRGDWITTN
jgi:hypothetical protein